MKIMITGSRRFNDSRRIAQCLDEATKGIEISEFISGNAAGVDRCGEVWAKSKGIPVVLFRPDYDKYADRPNYAPLARNLEMVAQADMCVAFPLLPRGESHGTEFTISAARKKGIKVIEFPVMERNKHVNKRRK